MIGVLVLLVAAATTDPRPLLVELQLAGEPAAVLDHLEAVVEEAPEKAAELGFAHLLGHLLEKENRLEDAAQAYLRAMAETPALASYSRFRLALLQDRAGHPEVAAGLAVPLLSRGVPRALAAPAAELLRRSLARGGDCRLLGTLQGRRFPAHVDRTLRLTKAECALRARDIGTASEILFALVRENRTDDAAREAAYLLAHLPNPSAREQGLLGLALHQHRHFDRALGFLEAALAELTDDDEETAVFEIHFAHLRSHFWQHRFRTSAEGFGQLADGASDPQRVAQAAYHQGRSFELLGDWRAATASYLRSFEAEPAGTWAGPALIGALRLEWLRGEGAPALELFERLAQRREWSLYHGRAALFLAASDLVQGRSDRAGAWLEAAARAQRTSSVEVMYWRGRLLEAEGRLPEAVDTYSRAAQLDVYHPLAQAALERVGREEVAPVARTLARRLARSPRLDDLHLAWLVLGDDDPAGEQARARLAQQLAADPRSQEFLRMARVEPKAWPLWAQTLRDPEELLLALGLWEEGAPAIARHFPATRPSLAVTGAELLAHAGQVRPALSLLDRVQQRAPTRIPPQFLPEPFRRLHHPFPFRRQIEAATAGTAIDPRFLAALIREESRFDPRALSPASARGLTQFVMPTADRVARSSGHGPLLADDLYRPEVAIRLGAAYLAELTGRFDSSLPQILAAYNAGTPQAQLWRRYCFSQEPEEYFTKVAFQETRTYLERVLSSYARYRELYPSTEYESTTGGSGINSESR